MPDARSHKERAGNKSIKTCKLLTEIPSCFFLCENKYHGKSEASVRFSEEKEFLLPFSY